MSTKGSGSPRGISRREFFKRAGQSAAAAAAVSTLGFPAVVRGAAADTIKIGHIHPLTGFLAFDGGQLRKGMLMAVDEINKAGGIKALGGAKLELLDGDSEGKPEVAITQMERFNSAGCLAVFGCYQSAVTLVATQEAEKYHIPFMVTVAVADEVTGIPTWRSVSSVMSSRLSNPLETLIGRPPWTRMSTLARAMIFAARRLAS